MPWCTASRRRPSARRPGKSPEGHIRIQFEMIENGRAFRMQCEDDGRGLTPDKLRKTAVTKGIISQNDAGRAVRPGGDDAGVPFRLLDRLGRHP